MTKWCRVELGIPKLKRFSSIHDIYTVRVVTWEKPQLIFVDELKRSWSRLCRVYTRGERGERSTAAAPSQLNHRDASCSDHLAGSTSFSFSKSHNIFSFKSVRYTPWKRKWWSKYRRGIPQATFSTARAVLLHMFVENTCQYKCSLQDHSQSRAIQHATKVNEKWRWSSKML